LSTPQKKNPSSRAEAGLVEEDSEVQPQDEAISDGSWLDEDAGEEVVTTPPSASKVAGMSEEEQSMEMTPVVVGPPGYGSPAPITSAGRLLPLDQHPFNPESLPEDHPARIDENYGKGYGEAISPEDVGTSFPGTSSGSDLENDLKGTAEEDEDAPSYEEQTKADLTAEAENRGLEIPSGSTKAEIVAILEEDDASEEDDDEDTT
jgi:hypothetical protein